MNGSTTGVRFDDLGKLILRLAVGGLMLFHGIAKLTGGVGAIKGMLAAKNLPEFMAYGTYVGEVLAPVLIIAGFLTRPAAAVLVVNMVVALALAHSSELFSLSPHGGLAIELPLLFLLGALSLVFFGGGRYGASKGRRKLE